LLSRRHIFVAAQPVASMSRSWLSLRRTLLLLRAILRRRSGLLFLLRRTKVFASCQTRRD
jgi:hypothetical protein